MAQMAQSDAIGSMWSKVAQSGPNGRKSPEWHKQPKTFDHSDEETGPKKENKDNDNDNDNYNDNDKEAVGVGSIWWVKQVVGFPQRHHNH